MSPRRNRLYICPYVRPAILAATIGLISVGGAAAFDSTTSASSMFGIRRVPVE